MAGADRLFRVALPVLVFPLFLTACASGGPQPPPRIDRIPESVDSRPASPVFGKDQLVSMARAGAKPEDVVEEWRRDGARLKLRATDLADLHARGVPLSVLDALLEAREQALRADLDTRLVQQQADFSARLAVEQARVQACPSPGYWGAYPYGAWGYPWGWRAGFYRGW